MYDSYNKDNKQQVLNARNDHEDKGKTLVEAQTTLLDPSSSDQADVTAKLYLFHQILGVVQTIDENLSGRYERMREFTYKAQEIMDPGNDHEDKGKAVVEAQTLSDSSSSQANDTSFDIAELDLFHQILQVFQTLNEKHSRYEQEMREFMDKVQEFMDNSGLHNA
ncbi:hypothetical protein LguiA_023598 [Lonicera macranthoides]